ncbi:hypothetical protein ACQ4M4_00075 [Leptolyngbya sp. AN02str]|uniref:hypothetical protein n=1 Tax=Leptolyngbya sp. AN02str TaxID=3423363 RepID=UPI003D319B33
MYLDQQSPSQHHPQLACPKCGHNSVVQHGNVYVCLSCNFHRNVSEPETASGVFSVIGIAVLIWLIVQVSFYPPASQPSLSPAYPSNIPQQP